MKPLTLNLRTGTDRQPGLLGSEFDGDPLASEPKAARPGTRTFRPDLPDVASDAAPVRLDIVTDAEQGNLF